VSLGTVIEVYTVDGGTIRMSMSEFFAMNGIALGDKSYHGLSNAWFDPIDKYFVKNALNELEPITQLYINGIEDVYEVPLETGVVKCTGDHKFLTKRVGSESYVWVAARDLVEGDDIKSY
jgi:intein/homing endonuclease